MEAITRGMSTASDKARRVVVEAEEYQQTNPVTLSPEAERNLRSQFTGRWTASSQPESLNGINALLAQAGVAAAHGVEEVSSKLEEISGQLEVLELDTVNFNKNRTYEVLVMARWKGQVDHCRWCDVIFSFAFKEGNTHPIGFEVLLSQKD